MFSSMATKIALRKSGLGAAQKDLNSILDAPKPNKDGTVPSQLPEFLTSNPFASYQLPPTWKSWLTPAPAPVPISINTPEIGSQAPSSTLLRVPDATGRPSIIAFLRGGGCPFAEKTFITLRSLANKHTTITFIAVSHSSAGHTQKWVEALGGAWNVRVVVDEERRVYAEWGLGVCGIWDVFGPSTWVAQRKLGTEEGIWARHVVDRSKELEEGRRAVRAEEKKEKKDKKKIAAAASQEEMVDIELTEEKIEGGSGNRWQCSGAFAVDIQGVVKWGARARSADDIPLLEEAVVAVKVYQ